MTSKGVDCWLRHWLKIQKKGEHPLVLRDPTAQPSKGVPNSAVVSKRKATRSKVWNIDSEEAEDRQTADALSDGGEAPAMPETTSDHASDRLGGASDAMALLVSPHSASESHTTRRTFLESLSTDVNYAELIHLLNVSPVSRRIL